MKLTSCTNPRWGDANHSSILCEVTFKEYGSTVLPFRAMPTDPELHGQDLYQRLMKGEFGPIAEHVSVVSSTKRVGPRDLG